RGARGDSFETAIAARVVARVAIGQTTGTAGLLTDSAGRCTAVAQVSAAGRAGTPFVPVRSVPAVAARQAVPDGQLDVGRTGVVGGQNAANEDERVGESAVGQGPPDRAGGVTGAELDARDVRVGDVVAAGCRVGVEGDNAERAHTFFPTQLVEDEL